MFITANLYSFFYLPVNISQFHALLEYLVITSQKLGQSLADDDPQSIPICPSRPSNWSHVGTTSSVEPQGLCVRQKISCLSTKDMVSMRCLISPSLTAYSHAQASQPQRTGSNTPDSPG